MRKVNNKPIHVCKFILIYLEFILITRIMELIHTTDNFNIKDACQGVRLQQNTVSPGRYHLKINIVILS